MDYCWMVVSPTAPQGKINTPMSCKFDSEGGKRQPKRNFSFIFYQPDK